MAILNGDQFLFAVWRRSHQHQDALLIFLQSNVKVDPIGPHVDVLLAFQAALAPLAIFVLPAQLSSVSPSWHSNLPRLVPTARPRPGENPPC